MSSTIFVTGISTEVGKTVAAAIIVEALKADYWKPVQAGDLHHTDSDKVASWISNKETVIHPTSIALNTPMSPHAAAEIDGMQIDAESITRPNTSNTLVIEGAGGLLVPLNDTETIIDLIEPTDQVILVSRHYLGSINHTLLSVNELRSRGLNNLGILFVGNEHASTESIIASMTNVPILGRIDHVPEINKEMVLINAEKLKTNLRTE